MEAALRAGLSIAHNCQDGICGQCLGRLLEGQLGEPDHFDYPLSNLEKAENRFLLCRAHAASDLVIEAGEASSVDDLPHQTLTGRVSRIDRLSPTMMILQIHTPRSRTLRFMAGQHVQLRIVGAAICMDFAVASCPCNGMVLSFHLHYREGSPFLEYAFRYLRQGDHIQIDGPYGRFGLDETSPRPVVIVAGNSGFASIKGLVEHMINIDKRTPLHLFWFATREPGHYYENYCRAWQDALDDYQFTTRLLAHTDEATIQEETHRLLAALPDAQGCDFYLAGPLWLEGPFVITALIAGIDEQRLHVAALRHSLHQAAGCR